MQFCCEHVQGEYEANLPRINCDTMRFARTHENSISKILSVLDVPSKTLVFTGLTQQN